MRQYEECGSQCGGQMDVGKEIRRAREAKGWSQAKLAGASDMGVSGISQIETGARNPSVVTLSKIADALGVEVTDLFPKGRRSSLEPSLFDGLEGGRRKPKLPEVADLLLDFAQMLLLTWEAELPARAQADDVQWLLSIRTMWQAFGLINYGVLEELGADGLRDKEGWLGKYMDLNAAVHRINAAIRDNVVDGASPDEETAVLLEPLAVA